MAELVGQGALAGPLGRPTGERARSTSRRRSTSRQQPHRRRAARRAGRGGRLGGDGRAAPARCEAPLLVAVDPLDGSSNIDANASVGTIFTVLPALQHNDDPSAFLQPGVNQLAAGFFVYGPQTLLA